MLRGLRLVSFFEPPPPPPEPPERPPYEPWMGPPDNALGGVVALELVVARSETTLVAVSGMSAYPQGFGFTLAVRWRTEPNPIEPRMFDPFHPGLRARVGGGLDPEVMRFGIEFADGRKVTNLQPHPHLEDESGEPPAGPMLMGGGGGGGGRRWDYRYWVWPLPPAGPLAFVCEWPAQDIPLTRIEIDAGLVLQAASRAQVVWEDDLPNTPSSDWSTTSMREVFRKVVSEESAPENAGES